MKVKKLLYDRVAIRVLPNKDEKIGGILLPETVQVSDIVTGVVVAKGDGMVNYGKVMPLTVDIGDKVVFSTKNTYSVQFDSVSVLITGEASIIAIVE